MNERILDLLQEAKSQTQESKWHAPTAVWAEKFAELIIKECIEQCSKALVEHTGQPSVTHNYAVGLCQDSIEEHFGIKEQPVNDVDRILRTVRTRGIK